MGDILFLAPRIPFPPNRGDKIRSHHFLRRLAQIAPVHVGCFAQDASDRAAIREVEAIAASHCVIESAKPLAFSAASALITGRAVSLAAFDDARLKRWVERTIAERTIAAMVIFSGQMGPYVPRDFSGRLIVDLCDVDSAKYEAYARSAPFAMAPIYRREARLLRRLEAALVARAHATTLVSEEEAALLRARLPDPSAGHLLAIGNGIDTAHFDPQTVALHPRLAGECGPSIVFTGQMDYPPNVDACLRMASNILPKIRQRHPDARFHVVGRAPDRRLRARHGKGGVHVWGEVPDVRPFLAGADLVLVPLTLARGVQNKVLEAMAMARPIVVSPQAAGGIGFVDSRHGVVASDNQSFVEAALTLLDNRAHAMQLGLEARRHVEAHASWQSRLDPLEALLQMPKGAQGERRDAA